jgi:hypothetical protein
MNAVNLAASDPLADGRERCSSPGGGFYVRLRLDSWPSPGWEMEFEERWNREGDPNHDVWVEEDYLCLAGPSVDGTDPAKQAQVLEQIRQCVAWTNRERGTQSADHSQQ